MTNIKTKEELLFEKYLSEAKVFVVDSQSVSRTRLIRLLKELGAKDHLISSISDYNEALEKLAIEKPKIVLSDYKLKNGSGFDLLRNYRSNHPESKEHIFILVTSNSSQSLVAQAAEEDVDSFILKPYTIDVIKATLIKTAVDKLYPSPYIQKIEDGKTKLFAGKPAEAILLFEEAKKMHKRPTIACFYLGQAELMKESVELAESSYKEGLTFNKIHYKCLVSLFDLFFNLKKFDEAYDIVKILSHYFPANPDRLSTVMSLAVRTNHFRDIEDYYEIFTSMDERSSDLLKYICAGLVVCGRFYFQKGETEKALNIFAKLGRSSANQTKFIRIAIENLIEFGHIDPAKEMFTRFDDKAKSSDDFAISKYLVTEHQLPPTESISKAMEFIQKDLHFYGVYLTLIKRTLQTQRKDQAEKYLNKALEMWPDKISLLEIKERDLKKGTLAISADR